MVWHIAKIKPGASVPPKPVTHTSPSMPLLLLPPSLPSHSPTLPSPMPFIRSLPPLQRGSGGITPEQFWVCTCSQVSFGAFSDKEMCFIVKDSAVRKYWKATISTQLIVERVFRPMHVHCYCFVLSLQWRQNLKPLDRTCEMKLR